MKVLYKKVQARQLDSTHSAGTSSSSTGQQGIFELIALTTGQLNRMKTVCSGGASTDNDTTMFVGHVKKKYFFRNQSNTVAKLTLYDITLKRQPQTALCDTVVECWSKGYFDMGLTLQHLEVGSTPFNSPEFKTFFRTHRVTVVNLEPGQQHEHTTIHRINRVISSSMFDTSSISAHIAGFTSYLVGVYNGSLGHESATPTTVSYMPITIDYTVHHEVHFGYIPQNRPSYAYLSSIPKNITDFDFMGEADDVDTSIVAA